MNAIDWDWVVFFGTIFLFAIMFGGEPDLHDAIVKRVGQYEEVKGK